MDLSRPAAWGQHKLGVPLPSCAGGMGVCLESRYCATTHGAVPPGSPVLHENWEVKVGDICLTPCCLHGHGNR